MEIEKNIKKILEEPINKIGYALDEVIFEKVDGINYLRIVIDNKTIITVDDCVKVSNLINPILDEKDPIDERYILDVCSKEKGNE